MSELYKKYRPKTFKQVVGQPEAVKELGHRLAEDTIPHALLFSGPSGVGKTTLARIVKTYLKCADHDFVEMNCADFRGIDAVREIRSQLGFAPAFGDCRIWLIDEAHQLTGDAQDAFLKMLEDTPSHVYFILATTLASKLKPTVRTRCTHITLTPIPDADMKTLLMWIRTEEKAESLVSEKVVDRIVEVSEGSARKAIVTFESCMQLDTDAEQLKVVLSDPAKEAAFNLVKEIIYGNASWQVVVKTLENIDGEPESIRRLILDQASKAMLKGGNYGKKGFRIFNAFRDDFFTTGKPGLIAACFEAVNG